jgi:hypothetical protein
VTTEQRWRAAWRQTAITRQITGIADVRSIQRQPILDGLSTSTSGPPNMQLDDPKPILEHHTHSQTQFSHDRTREGREADGRTL